MTLIEIYNQNPNKCNYCNQDIIAKEGTRLSDVKRKKFCNSSCAASYNNKKSPKRQAVKEGNCCNCRTVIKFEYDKNKQTYKKRQYCNSCLEAVKIETLTKHKNNKLVEYMSKTKGEIKKTLKNPSSALRNQARRIYANSDKPKACHVCGYDKHTEIAHIKGIAEFNDDDKISEINSIDNLIALCPNHHWEFDNKLLDL